MSAPPTSDPGLTAPEIKDQTVQQWWKSAAFARVMTVLIVVASLAFILHTWTLYDQTWDENDHIAGGMEWISHHTFAMDPVDPPLPRIAVALGPYLLGARLPASAPQWLREDEWTQGNLILGTGNYHHILYAARAGTLIFFLLAVYLVWSRTRDWLGEAYACVAVGLFCLSPSVLANSSIATTDASIMATFFWALDRLWRLSRDPSVRNALLAGVAIAAALVSKMAAGPYLFLSVILMLVFGWLSRHYENPWRLPPPKRTAILIGTTLLCIWATYLFSVGSLIRPGKPDLAELTHVLQKHHIPSRPVFAIVNHIPAQDFIVGLRDVRYQSSHAAPKYFMGRIRKGGSRLFFPVMFAVKFPIPFVLLSIASFGLALLQITRRGRWNTDAALLLIGAAVPFLIGISTHVNMGVRHILAAMPFLAMLGAFAVQRMWQSRKAQTALRLAVVACGIWLAVSCMRALPDPLPWMNEAAAGRGAWFSADSDFDWGQDLKRLPVALADLHAGNVAIAISTSANLNSASLPTWRPLKPNEKPAGWVAASEFMIRNTPDSYGWLNTYQPVGHAGKSIRLYYFSAPPAANAMP